MIYDISSSATYLFHIYMDDATRGHVVCLPSYNNISMQHHIVHIHLPICSYMIHTEFLLCIKVILKNDEFHTGHRISSMSK